MTHSAVNDDVTVAVGDDRQGATTSRIRYDPRATIDLE